jgi:retinol dehydrogenase-12/retinol dehydrogenase-13
MMDGKVAVVTGANAGIGLETARGLAALGATTVLACRNASKAETARADIRVSTGNADVHVVPIDLADLASVQACADEVRARWDRLDVLVNNAGGVWTDRRLTAQGFEQTFGVNHLGPFLLTNRLLDHIGASAPSRIVNVSSVAHHMAWRGMPFDDLQNEKRYKEGKAYGRSKLANLLFTRALATRLDGTGVDAYAVHPGPVSTDLGRDGDLRGITALGMTLARPFGLSAAAGARTSIYVATAPEVAGHSGDYWVRSKPGHMARRARSAEQAERLWQASATLLERAGFPLR